MQVKKVPSEVALTLKTTLFRLFRQRKVFFKFKQRFFIFLTSILSKWEINWKVSPHKSPISNLQNNHKSKVQSWSRQVFGFPPSLNVYLWVTLGPKSQNPIPNFLSNPNFKLEKKLVKLCLHFDRKKFDTSFSRNFLWNFFVWFWKFVQFMTPSIFASCVAALGHWKKIVSIRDFQDPISKPINT